MLLRTIIIISVIKFVYQIIIYLLYVPKIVSLQCCTEVERFYTNTRTCYEVYNKTICYFQPIAANRHMTWDDAWTVCKENNSTLPVIENRMMAETFRRHLESKTLLRSEAWLAGREERPNVWQWLNGKRFGLISILKGTI